MTLLSEAEKITILREDALNLSILKISKKIRRNESTIRPFLNRFKARKSLQNYKSTGRPSKITVSERRFLTRTAKKKQKCHSRTN